MSFLTIAAITVVVVLYPKWRVFILPKNRRIVVRFINGATFNQDSVYNAIRNLQPSLNDALAVCGLTRDDLLEEAHEDASWQWWPEKARTINYRGHCSDRILYERYFYAKSVFVVFNQILDCSSGRRKNSIHRATYESLAPEQAKTTDRQYKTRQSNMYPSSRMRKRDKIVRGHILNYQWLEIPSKASKSDRTSESIRLLSWGESENKLIPERLKAIQVSKSRRVAAAGRAMISNQKGGDPSLGFAPYDPMGELNSLVGLSSVKKEVESLRDFISVQKMRKEKGLQSSEISLHTVFTGNPGTGKTTVARIIASIFHEAGLLPTDNLIEVDRSGLVGQYIGETAIKTNGVIDSAMGGVLFIDEAYSLAHKNDTRDFGHEAIATLLKRMEDDRGRFAVILAGYTDNMNAFMNDNPGLKSRFPRTIEFSDYSAEELSEIYKSMLEQKGYSISGEAERALMRRIEDDVKAKDKQFGNGRYVRNLFEKTIQNQAARVKKANVQSESQLMLLTEEDIPTSEKRENDSNPLDTLNSLIGLTSVKEEMRSLRNFISLQKKRKEKGLQTSDISLHTVFTGNPGTGKTTVARIVAAIFHEAGLLPTERLVEVDRSGLVGQYVGETAIKTNEMIDKAIGGVLFIDEAYALSQGGQNDFGKEAITTLIKRMEEDRGRFAVILAGYTDDMNMFMEVNPGLRSRFPRIICFPDYTEDELVQIFKSMANSQGYKLTEESVGCLRSHIEADVKNKDEKFGNGRYVRNLFERAIQHQADRLEVLSDPSNEDLVTISEDDIKAV